MGKLNTLSLTELVVLIVFVLLCSFLVYYYWKNVVIPMNEYHKKRIDKLVKEREEYEKAKQRILEEHRLTSEYLKKQIEKHK